MSLVVLPLVLQVDLPVDLTKYVIVAVPFDEALVEASCIELTNGPTVHTAFLLPLFSVVCLVAKTSILVMLTEQVLCPPPRLVERGFVQLPRKHRFVSLLLVSSAFRFSAILSSVLPTLSRNRQTSSCR